MRRALALAVLAGLAAGCAAKPFLLDGTESRAEVGFSGYPNTAETKAIARAHCGTFEACLSRPTFPAINAGAAKRNTCQKGKFQGIIARIGPIGRYRTKLFFAPVSTASSARNFSLFSA